MMGFGMRRSKFDVGTNQLTTGKPEKPALYYPRVLLAISIAMMLFYTRYFHEALVGSLHRLRRLLLD